MRQLVGVVLAAALTSCAAPTPTPDGQLRLVPYTAPPHVTGAWPSTCLANGAHPDPACTPGSISSTNQTEVCTSGYSASHRPPEADTSRAKTTAMRAYRIPVTQRATTELDHLVPESLGGSNDASNLWPQPSDLPASGFRNTKDSVETTIWWAVCHPRKGSPAVPLADAQQAIARDWTTALNELGLAA